MITIEYSGGPLCGKRHEVPVDFPIWATWTDTTHRYVYQWVGREHDGALVYGLDSIERIQPSVGRP